MAAEHAAMQPARDHELGDGAQAGRLRVQPFVDMEIERELMVLREVEHAPQLGHDALVAIDESAERAARALHGAGDALAGFAIGEQIERHQRDELQLDAAVPLRTQFLEDRERGRRLGAVPVQVRAQGARAGTPGFLQRALHARTQRVSGPVRAVRGHAPDGREQVALGRAHLAHGVVLVDVRMRIDHGAEQGAARRQFARFDGRNLRAGQRDVEDLRIARRKAPQARRDAHGFEPHAACVRGSARSQPRPPDVPLATAPRRGRYSQPTQPCQPHWADTSSITSNR